MATRESERSPASVKFPCDDPQSFSQVEFARPTSRKCVRFDDAALSVYEVIPYAEIYGLHPRDFVFDASYCMLPAVGFADIGATCNREEADDDYSESDEEDTPCTSR